MFPILVSFGSFTVYTFGLFLTLAFVMGLFVYWRFLKEAITNVETIFDSAFFAIAGALLGSRLLFVMLHPALFWPHIWQIIDVFHYPGYAYYGAVIGGLVFLTWYCRRIKEPLRPFLDRAVLATSIAHTIGLLGAFFSGSGYGAVTRLFWGVSMSGLVDKRQPVQIIEALTEIVIFGFLFFLYRRRHQEGILAIYYVVCYTITRIFIEFLRGDSVYWGPMRSQIILSGIILAFALLYLQRRFIRFSKKAGKV